MSSTWKQTLPVIQNQNNFSCFESQFVIFSSLKVIQRADLSGLLHYTTTGRVRVQGPGLRLRLLLLQGQFDGWEGEDGGVGEEADWKDLGYKDYGKLISEQLKISLPLARFSSSVVLLGGLILTFPLELCG